MKIFPVSGGDGKTYTKQDGQALSWTGEHVDYNQVIGSYTSQAYHQIDQSNYPKVCKTLLKIILWGLINSVCLIIYRQEFL